MRENLLSVSETRIYFFLATLLLIYVTWAVFSHQLPVMEAGGDFWEHAAVLKTWMEDIRHPASPHVATMEGSSRYMPFYFLITVLSKLLGLDALKAMGLASVASVAIFLLGIHYFATAYFKEKIAPLYTLLIVLCCWGFAWNWSNAYQLRNFVYITPYPSFFVFAFSFLIFGCVAKTMDAEVLTLRQAVFLGLSIPMVLLCHPLTGVFSLFFVFLLTWFRGVASTKFRFFVTVVVAASCLLVETWPYFSTYELVLGKSSGEELSWINKAEPNLTRWKRLIWGHPFYSPFGVLLALFPVFIGLVMVVRPKIQLSRWKELPIAALAMLCVYILNMFVNIPLGHRALLLAVLPLHLMIVVGLLNIRQDKGHILPTFFFTLIVSLNLLLVLQIHSGSRLQSTLEVKRVDFSQSETIPEKLAPILEQIEDDSVVMTDRLTGWAIPSQKGKIVSRLHQNPLIHDRLRRKYDTRIFFDESTDLGAIKDIVDRYRITHILLAEPRSIRRYSNLGIELISENGYTLLAINR